MSGNSGGLSSACSVLLAEASLGLTTLTYTTTVAGPRDQWNITNVPIL